MCSTLRNGMPWSSFTADFPCIQILERQDLLNWFRVINAGVFAALICSLRVAQLSNDVSDGPVYVSGQCAMTQIRESRRDQFQREVYEDKIGGRLGCAVSDS